nr:DUF1800 family protein [Bacteroidia bacterium]
IGIGNYSEKDVKEGARAFDGWTYDKTGGFLVKQEHHDNGLKTYHGETGNFDGNDIIRILLARKECATFITTKIYKYFVNHIPDKIRITQLSTEFYNSEYDIEFLMKKIVSSEWFYNKENIGVRVKTPLELIAGISKLFNIKFEDPLLRLPIQKVLGQSLFDPPNVAGWPEGLGWIDSSSLMYRLRLPEVLLQDAETLMAPKEEFDALETMKFQSDPNLRGKKIKTVYDASSFNAKFRNKTSQDLMNSISEFLLQKKPSPDKYKLIDSFTNDSIGDTRILKTAIYFMSLPEYQLC